MTTHKEKLKHKHFRHVVFFFYYFLSFTLDEDYVSKALMFLIVLYVSSWFSPMCFQLFFMCHHIGEYISLELFCFVILTSSCSLISKACLLVFCTYLAADTRRLQRFHQASQLRCWDGLCISLELLFSPEGHKNADEITPWRMNKASLNWTELKWHRTVHNVRQPSNTTLPWMQ